MFKLVHKGDWEKTFSFLKRAPKLDVIDLLHHYGRVGCQMLETYTPKDTGVTSRSWSYQVFDLGTTKSVQWDNKNIVNGVKIAVIIQFGHATKGGGYVVGRDYINPALRPVFDSFVVDLEREVKRL